MSNSSSNSLFMLSNERSLTIVVACLNEEANLWNTYASIRAALNEISLDDVEIIIVNDGSTDKTGSIAEQIAAQDTAVIVVHHKINLGFGTSMSRGIEMSRMKFMIVLPGDNEISYESIRDIIKYVGSADIIMPFTINMELRTRFRGFISRAFTLVMNTLFLCDLQYYNGPAVHRVDLLRKIGVSTTGFAFQAMIATKIIRMGYTVFELPMYIQQKAKYRSSAVSFRNILSVARDILRLFVEIYGNSEIYSMPFIVNRVSDAG